MQRFSSSELFKLRNAIPVEILIQNILRVPFKTSEGFFRFLCPVCNEFQTGINPNVNLVRCFRCERNFNVIDLVMETQDCGFKESVLYLKRVLGENVDQCNDHSCLEVQKCSKTG